MWKRCETGSWAIPGRRSKRMPNVAAAGGRPAVCDLYYGLKEDYSGGDAAGERWRSEHAK